MSDALISVQNVVKRYGEVGAAVAGVSFDVPRGAIVALLGPSGCGKTTTLRLIAGLEMPNAGAIWLEGRKVAGDGAWVPPEARRVGMVFQDGALFPHLTVAQNIAFPLNTRNGRGRVEELLELVGMAGYGERYPHQLSGGQQQRVALARALAPEPAVVLLDEPFSRLDAALRVSLREDVREIVKRTGATTIFVTHDQEEALSIADIVVVMFDGKAAQIGAPHEIYTRPATRQVATFVGEANLLPGLAEGAVADCALGRVILATPQKGAVEIMIRPEAFELRAVRSGAAYIERIRYFGHDQALHVRLHSGEPLLVRSLPRPDLRVGQEVDVFVRGVVVAYPAN
ncbi:MAG: ABC transporter ATP-binding protein [Caldilinea sp.]|uniref:ABC transporter ATP-binding protein n=1 Tax=Caldilinea sp. TaxID=2293560 RepID=UPI00309E7BB9